jgi:hypothetical protein
MPKETEPKSTLSVLPTIENTHVQKEIIKDSVDLSKDESAGKLIGYATVAIYSDGHNSRFEIPDTLDPVLFYSYISELLRTEIYEIQHDINYEEFEE